LADGFAEARQGGEEERTADAEQDEQLRPDHVNPCAAVENCLAGGDEMRGGGGQHYVLHQFWHALARGGAAIAHLAGTSVRMIIKNYYEPHSSETEKAAALLPKLGTAQEAPLRLVKQVQVA